MNGSQGGVRMNWTKEQRQVIDIRNRNILVSAAAGSGKTAVLVERILARVMDRDDPIDLDRLLVVTFTKAAAAEMKERIGKALEERAYRDPENLRLQRQASLLPHAQISTIDSFCMGVVKSYHHWLELEAGFRVGEEGEMNLVKADAMEAVLEAGYAKCAEDSEEGKEFVHLVETFAPGKSDESLEDVIYRLYERAMSNPWPKEWLAQCKEALRMETVRQMEDAEWMQGLMASIRKSLSSIKAWNREVARICELPEGPDVYGDMVEDDGRIIDGLLEAEGYSSLYEGITDVRFMDLSRKKGGDPEWRELAKGWRNKVKKGIEDIKKRYFYQSPERMLADVHGSRDAIWSLLDLTEGFLEQYAAEKAEKNLLDFHDLEHYALQILTTREDGAVSYTAVADELMEYYEEIMIDEYQDGNLVQETILNALSRERRQSPAGEGAGTYNLFMVGDVKQSIYRFRLARPELFMEKYDKYHLDEGPCQKIDLQKNFRSRGMVLEGVNLMFRHLMKRELGGVEYDEAAALHPGREFAATEERTAEGVDVLLVCGEGAEGDADAKESASKSDVGKSKSDAKESASKSDVGKSKSDAKESASKSDVGKGKSDAKESASKSDVGKSKSDVEEKKLDAEEKKRLEVRAIGERIREMTSRDGGLYISEGEGYRLAEYRDVVILLRSMDGWAETFVEELLSMGVPAYAEAKAGYFSTLEVQTVLGVLKIIDNPLQDIPLAAVLRSPIGGFSNEDLAMVRVNQRDGTLYDALCAYCQGDEVCWDAPLGMGEVVKEAEERVASLRERVEGFLTWLDAYRQMASHAKVYELVQRLYQDTGYYYQVMALPDGDRRGGNLDALLQKAVDYDSTSYRGLFGFNRYMEKLDGRDVDYGEASVVNEGGNVVRVMSVHKSKGLEFPIVFASGMGKQINRRESSDAFAIHSDWGVGTNRIDYGKRTKAPTILQRAIQNRIKEESVGEELRVLYVATTRAKERLVITGCVDEVGKALGKWSEMGNGYLDLMGCTTYLDLIMPPVLDGDNPGALKHPFQLCVCMTPREAAHEAMDRLAHQAKRNALLHWDVDMVHDEVLGREMVSRRDYRYPYMGDSSLPILVSVSELKRRSAEDEEAVDARDAWEGRTPKEEPVPRFEGETPKDGGVAKNRIGVAYHAVMQHLRFGDVRDMEDLKGEVGRLVRDCRIKEEEAEWVDLSAVLAFLKSDIGQRMREAEAGNVLFKENPFVIGLPAEEVDASYKSKEMVLVQGIIDAFFEEEDGLTLVDYKTDEIKKDAEGELAKRYGLQLRLYKRALERITGKRVKETVIYSFSLGKVVHVPLAHGSSATGEDAANAAAFLG